MEAPKRCTECGHQVSEQARFCERCGSPLAAGAEPLRAPDALARKILGERAAIEGERKQVTVMFIDIVGSMELTRSLDTERWGVVLDRFLAIASGAIHGLEGTVNQFTGDGLMAVFGAPIAHEDHARRACLALLDVQREVAVFAEELEASDGVKLSIRCGLNSGEVIVGSIGDDLHMDFAPIGNTSGLAKRMEALAPEGSAAISASTASLVRGEFELRELGEFEIKGMNEPQHVFELIGPGTAHTRLEAAAEARGLSRFVGRRTERAKLEAALDRALAGRGQAVGVVGEPGVGKSRLVRVFVAECRERGLLINSANAVAHGRAVPLLPVLAMFRDYFGIRDRTKPETARELIEARLAGLDSSLEADLPLVFDFLGVPDLQRPVERIDPEARQRRLLSFVDRLVEAQGRAEPAVLLIEDLHWIDEASAIFLDRLVQAVEGTRTLLIATFRPEYTAEWMNKREEQEITLPPLDSEESGELLGELLGRDPSLDGLAEAIRDRTAGNPFFIEELVQALAETGHLSGEPGAYRPARPLEELVLPPSVQAVLSARIDRLGAREKALVQTMSVIGREVPEPVLCEVSELGETELDEAVAALEEAEFLVEPKLNGLREFSFKHPLTQEVAYASQLSAARARAHTAVAEAIERLYADGLDERAALLAHHAEAAGETLKAAEWHARAAAWVSVSSPAEGMRHWRRVRELADELDVSPEVEQLAVLARISILALAWRLGMSNEETAAIHAEGQARLTGDSEGELREAEPVAFNAQGSGTAEEITDRATEQLMLEMLHAANLFFGGSEVEGTEILRPGCRRALGLGQPGLALLGAVSAGIADWTMGFPREGFEFADTALGQAGDEVLAGAGLILGVPYAHALWVRGVCGGYLGGLHQAQLDLERSLELADTHDDRECEGSAHACLAFLHSQVNEWEEAISHAERAGKLAEVFGNNQSLASQLSILAEIRAHFEDFDVACEYASRGLAIAREHRVGLLWEPDLLAALALARLGLGDHHGARQVAEEAVSIAQERSLRKGEILAQLALSRVLAAMEGVGAADTIDRSLRRALVVARHGEYLLTEPRIHRQLAALARLRGDESEAQREEAEAQRILAEITAPQERDKGDDSAERVLLDVAYAANLFFGGQELGAVELLRGASSAAAGFGDPGLVLIVSAFRGVAAWAMGSFREGAELTDRALKLAGENLDAGAGVVGGNPYAQCLWIRAYCEGSLGMLDRAWRDLDRSLEMAAGREDPECELYALNARALLRSDILEPQSGLADAERALGIAERTGNNQALAAVWGTLAQLRGECGDLSGERAAAERAVTMIREQGAGLTWEPDNLTRLARARLRLGDEGEAARALAEEAVAIAERRSLKRAVVLTRIGLAQALMEANGIEAAEAIERALDGALGTATEIGYRSTEPRIHRELATLARLRGNEAEAEREEDEAERILVEMGVPRGARTAG